MKEQRTATQGNPALPGQDGTSGVSEVVGAILLVAVVVIMVGIIAVYFNSQTPAQEIPNVNFMIGINNQNPPTLFLTHNGGNTLTDGTFSVYVDGVLKSYTIQDGGTTWSIGKSLVIPLPSGAAPQNIALVYNTSATGTTVIGSAAANLSAPLGHIPVYNLQFPTPTPTPSSEGYIINSAGSIMNSSYFIPAIQQNLTNNRISFYKSGIPGKGNGALGLSCHGMCYDNTRWTRNFTFMVTDTTDSSYITYNTPGSPLTYSLDYGDIVTISFSSSDVSYVTAFGIAPQIWEFAAAPAGVQIKFANGTVRTTAKNTELVHTYVAKYSMVESTLVIDDWGNSDTSLMVNQTQRILGLSSTDIGLVNIEPVPVGLFVIHIDTSNNNVYFVGTADGIYYNNVRQTFL
ncbi:type IV pilin N-terminal domain-containing protein [uncultured Methanoregula sp.]|uniref:type IV pilin N-terminal domain-containing protein n=1 Tax=uncultured Methanoregula sp. TaxID=1005933 RepID=UPI002AAC1B5E|nr:type IV pilin N-terminal domain-containing protein [uncultured Methanoregula sp.]